MAMAGEVFMFNTFKGPKTVDSTIAKTREEILSWLGEKEPGKVGLSTFWRDGERYSHTLVIGTGDVALIIDLEALGGEVPEDLKTWLGKCSIRMGNPITQGWKLRQLRLPLDTAKGSPKGYAIVAADASLADRKEIPKVKNGDVSRDAAMVAVNEALGCYLVALEKIGG